MAVYTELTDDFIRYMLAIYADAGELKSAHGISAGSTNTSYRLETNEGQFFLRVNENKFFSDLLYEKNLLLHLEQQSDRMSGVLFPEMLRNAAGGYFFPVEPGGVGKTVKYACIFRGLQGRELAPFEVSASQVHQLGRVLAQLHLGLRAFRGGRPNPYGAERMRAWLCGMPPRRELDVINKLKVALDDVLRHRRALPRGVIHGDLFANNTKWQRSQLHAIFDWEMAGRDHLLLDLAIVLNAWCWQRSATGAGTFDAARLQSLVQGYISVRPLTATEVRSLHRECRLAALRFAISRYRDFGEAPNSMGDVVTLSPPTESPTMGALGIDAETHRDFLDYQEYWERHEVWHTLGRKGTLHLLGLDKEQPHSRRAVSRGLSSQ